MGDVLEVRVLPGNKYLKMKNSKFNESCKLHYRKKKSNFLKKITEELSELSVEIHHMHRHGLENQKLLEEIGDVEFRLETLKSLMSSKAKKNIKKRIALKKRGYVEIVKEKYS